ncbi:RES family NAD+ phosphorylase [Spirosoma telluris]|uniref:RES family NAD+ phosphorylase n=1 Tax=Spirosoma telluris TaxID=2183553 RepID=UPI0038CD5E83
MALVESLVHQPRVKYDKLPKLVLFTLEVPDDSLTTLSPDDLPAYWNEESYEKTQWILRDWLNEPTTLVKAIPSVVAPMSYNYLTF